MTLMTTSPFTPERNGKTALITGITGQDGSYLAELLLGKGYEVWGLARRSSSVNTGRIDHLLAAQAGNDQRLRLEFGDLTDTSSIHNIIGQAHPDEIYHLGAQSHVHISFQLPEYTGNVTGLGTVRMLESVRQLGLHSRFYQASTSELFGRVRETPQTESTPFHPRSPYGAAKAYAFDMARNYREAYGMFTANGILFNHESPRRGEMFVSRKISLGVARILAGQQDCLLLGNLDARRDWGFAGDYVTSMWLMLQAEKPDDFVVATGQAHSVRQFCELAFARVQMPLTWEGSGLNEVGRSPDGRVVVRVDPLYFRPAEVDYLLGDASKARRELNWKPQVTFEELVNMMVDHDVALTGLRGA